MDNEQEDQDTQSTDEQGAEEATPENQDEVQSEDSKEAPVTYRVDGKDLTPDELYQKHLDLRKGFTQTTQRISALEKKMSERADKSETTQKVLENVPDDVRSAVLEIVKPELNKILSERDRRIAAEERQREWDNKFEHLAKTYDGKGGKPKFNPVTDKERVLEYIQETGTVFDPIVAFEMMHKDEIRDYWVKQALSKKSGTAPTERTSGAPGGSTLGRSKKTPKTLSEASESAMRRLSS